VESIRLSRVTNDRRGIFFLKGNRVRFLLAFMTFIAVACTGSTGCSRRTSIARPPDLETVKHVFDSRQQSNDEPAAAFKDLDLYIDASMSMRGFVHDPETKFKGVLQNLFESAVANQYRVARFRFSGPIIDITGQTTGSLMLESFYNGVDTPLGRLLTGFADPNKDERVSVVLSDLIQSDVGTEESALIQGIQTLLSKHREIALLGFRSSFNGPYYVEGPRTSSTVSPYTLRLPQTLPNTGRPFYILVIAPNRPSYELLFNTVLRHLGFLESFVPTDMPVNIDEIRFDPLDRNNPNWRKYGSAQKQEMRNGARRFYTSYLTADRAAGSDGSLRLKLQAQLRLELESPAKIDFEAHKASFRNAKAGSVEEVAIQPTVQMGNSGSALTFNVAYRPTSPPKGGWDVYRVQMRAGIGNAVVPSWLTAWNTNSDSSSTNGNKTYRLNLLGEALVRSISEKVVFCEHYVVITGDK